MELELDGRLQRVFVCMHTSVCFLKGLLYTGGRWVEEQSWLPVMVSKRLLNRRPPLWSALGACEQEELRLEGGLFAVNPYSGIWSAVP